MEHSLFIYLSRWWAPGQWVIDCEQHSLSLHSGLFSDAVGRALLHRFEAHEQVAL